MQSSYSKSQNKEGSHSSSLSAFRVHSHEVMLLAVFAMDLAGMRPELKKEDIGRRHSMVRSLPLMRLRECWMRDQASEFTPSGLRTVATLLSALEAACESSPDDLNFPALQDDLGIAAAAVAELIQHRKLLFVRGPMSGRRGS